MKIGFIAMSGVRAHNAELTKLGLTLPGFVERNKIIASLPSLSLLTLAGLTPSKYQVEYREIADLKAMDSLPEDYDLVAISTFTAQVYEAYQVADFYISRKIPVVMGGLTISSLVDEAGEHCTSVVVGEGEPLWPQVLADFERGALKPLYVQSPHGRYDLREAPMPRFDLLDPDKYNRLTVQTSRGCPHKCDFCASSILLTPLYKLKPVEKVIAEIHAIKRLWPRPFIEFADDNSFVNRGHYKKLLRELAKEKVRWFTEADLNVAKDDELLGLMRDSGCQQVLIGLESPRRASLDGMETNANWKLRQQEHYLAAIEKIQSYGVTVNGCFILGLDGDTPEVFDEVFNFVRESGLYEVQITFMTAFPGTPLYQRLKNEGRLLRDRAWELCTLFDINFRPKNMTVEELQSGFLSLAKRLYSADETAARRRKFKTGLRTSPNFGRVAKLSDRRKWWREMPLSHCMKILLLPSCLSALLLCGCTTTSLEFLHLMGAKTAHETMWCVDDSPANRLALVIVVKTVATQFDFRDYTETRRLEMLKFSAPIQFDTNSVIGSYRPDETVKESQGITLEAYEWQGQLIASIYQQNWRKARSKKYIQIHDALVAGLKKRFGAARSFRESDGVMFLMTMSGKASIKLPSSARE